MPPDKRQVLLAHSAPNPGAQPHSYRDHIECVANSARAKAKDIAVFARDPSTAKAFVNSVVAGATFHDLGKLDPDNQAVLHKGRNTAMPWDHVDAGVAHLLAYGAGSAAWAVRAHHAPGLPNKAEHFSARARNADQVRQLRGTRRDDDDPVKHEAQKKRTDDQLQQVLRLHQETLGPLEIRPGKTTHGLPLRLVLSCLVDADHSDTAFFDTGRLPPKSPAPRWTERLNALDSYVKGLQEQPGERRDDRAAFYDACRNRAPDAAFITCQGAVGIGKTTAVVAYLLKRAIATDARRLFIVAPYTAILSQTAKRLRSALVLADEQEYADTVVAEHHHRADFDNIASRDLAVLWAAPIVLTTAVQFFETLASNAPSNLRKLHALPGSVVFIDEAHAACRCSFGRKTGAG